MAEKIRDLLDEAYKEYILSHSSLAAMTNIAIALNDREGAGFFISGPIRSGKTRLLKALQYQSMTQGASPQLKIESDVLNDPDPRQTRFVRKVFQAHRIAACYVSLGTSNQSLSRILQEAIHQQHPQILPRKANLLDSLDVIDAGLLKSDYDMLVLLVDELASNLDSKSKPDALRDTIFLQQIGETLGNHRIVLILAVHKSISTLDNLRYDQLSKFKDYYQVLPLHINGALVERFTTHFDNDDLVVAMPRSYQRELHDAIENNSLHEFQGEYDPSKEETPDWLAAIEPAEEEPEPIVGEMPDWLKMPAAEAPAPAPLTEELEAEEIPDWLAEMAPDEERQTSARIPERLKETKPPVEEKEKAEKIPLAPKEAAGPMAEAEAPETEPEMPEIVVPAETERSTPPTTTIKNPVRKLAKILMERCDRDGLDFFLQSKGIKGKTLEARVLELCVIEDPDVILKELFGIGRLKGIARDLKVETEPNRSPDQWREAILIVLGFSTPKKPAGIRTYIQKLLQLRGALRLKDQRADIIGIGLEGCDDVGERVLKDIIAFYCTLLLGKDYEKALWEKKLVPAKGRPNLDGLTFGQKIGLFERLNGHLKKSKEAKDRMYKWFDRDWVIKNNTHVQRYLNQVSPRRNHLAHSQGIDTPTLKREADEALELLVELFEQFEKQLIYPPVIAVEALQVDKYGRHIYICVDDRGCPERLFTDMELVIGQAYFFYPITNPIRVDPLIIPKL
jgi:hypothetical protein